ncbi:hypothetical protein ANN_20206 [Periplaneta americana]|uniref:Uncharacterized protein n=1 Tax=Periplaneta americana TaxID=6978 RepID=A0ABQ8SC07_PERAM|nr:hypothetical protein ANN_20206 [Periplaneta americana]
MADLCEGGNEPSGSLKAICKAKLKSKGDSASTRALAHSELEKHQKLTSTDSADVLSNDQTSPYSGKHELHCGNVAEQWLVPQLRQDLDDDFIFQQDGAPPHFYNAVRAYLNTEMSDRWIGRAGNTISTPLDDQLKFRFLSLLVLAANRDYKEWTLRVGTFDVAGLISMTFKPAKA